MGYSLEWEYYPAWTHHGVFQYAHMVPKRVCDFCGSSATTTAAGFDICDLCLAQVSNYADVFLMDVEVVAGLFRKMGRRPHGIEYGKHWRDHVPTHSKHLIKESP